MIVKMTKDVMDFRKFLVMINKMETDLTVQQIRNRLSKITKIKFKIVSDVHDKARLESIIVNNREVRRKWMNRDVEIPEDV